ncbi:ABC transporter permease [Methylophilus aquaticus]|uniref:ABC transporter permease n=1 Tax=Methylophilus aquaticus TaxID=1971610 RepID=A0ABT9JPD9_9PROT|nr:ABC transporter permease [Methylophilus aquaticus]MDP8566364.1 ABC transporter permease [Methylophilus aquaticus]
MSASVKTPGYWRLLWVLYCKEWFRLKRNPAAMMAAGLIVLMAFLVSLENRASRIAQRQAQQPCAVVYSLETPLIAALKASKTGQTTRFIQLDASTLNHGPKYASSISCVAEIQESPAANHGQQQVALTFRAGDLNSPQLAHLSRWVLGKVATLNPQLALTQQLKPLTERKPTPTTLGKIDLGSDQAKGMIGGMMIFSAQFFICCAMFIGFTGYERERGVLQALALTTTQPGQMIFAKLLFHVSVSVLTSVLIYKIISGMPWDMMLHFAYFFITIFGFSSMGFVAIATIITSLNRTQTTASLVGFCYLMLMGVIFALATKIKAFALIKGMMFENHAIQLFQMLLYGPASKMQGITMFYHMLAIVVLSNLLWLVAYQLFKRRGWRMG